MSSKVHTKILTENSAIFIFLYKRNEKIVGINIDFSKFLQKPRRNKNCATINFSCVIVRPPPPLSLALRRHFGSAGLHQVIASDPCSLQFRVPVHQQPLLEKSRQSSPMKQFCHKSAPHRLSKIRLQQSKWSYLRVTPL